MTTLTLFTLTNCTLKGFEKMSDRMHPDDLARKITALAEENGYGVTKLDLVSLHMVNRAVAHHSYASGYIISQEMSGRGKVAMTAPIPKDTR